MNTKMHCWIVLAWVLSGCFGSAHAATTGAAFDHFSTGFPLSGQHVRTACEACHVKGVFKGTPAQCGGCHNGGIAPGKTGRHIASSNTCDDCHTAASWKGARMDHSTVTAKCESCHNGVQAPGKHALHIQTRTECAECHGTLAWSPARFDHAEASGRRCVTCHDDRIATGKSGSHVPTTNDCGTCHDTRYWKPAKGHHDNITSRCDACHNGKFAKGKHNGHPQVTADCDACHNTITFKNPIGRVDHSNIVSGCGNCHNNKTATGKSSGHFVTARECNICHRTTPPWSALVFAHMSPGYPSNHPGTCIKCHAGKTETANWTAAQYKPDCAGCHAAKYRQASHLKTEKPQTTYTVAELRNCLGACHLTKEDGSIASPPPRHSVNATGW